MEDQQHSTEFLFPLTHSDQKIAKGLFDWNIYLVIVAHPDDAEYCCGGTVSKLVKSGKEVRYVIVTDGDKGTKDFNMNSEKLANIRREEQTEAANVLGVKSVDFLHFKDGEVQDNLMLREAITRMIRKYHPEVVLTFSPERNLSLYYHSLEHTDHRQTGSAVLDSCYPTARNFLFFPHQFKDEGLQPCRVKQVYLFSWEWVKDNPLSNVIVDIEHEMQDKVTATLKHKSQIANPAKEEQSLLSLASSLGKPHNIKYAEYFSRVMLPS